MIAMQYTNTTKDYERFRLFSINRKKLHEPTIKKLMESMEKSGFVSTITVSSAVEGYIKKYCMGDNRVSS